MYATVHKSEPASAALSGSGAFSVVGVASSAGGLRAAGELLASLPPDFPCPIIAVQHLPSAIKFQSRLDRVWSRHTKLAVKWAEDGEVLRPGVVFVAPQDQQIVVADRRIRLYPGDKVNGVRPAADPLFTSLALEFGARAIGVVLSGALSDGAQGAYDIAVAGGRVLGQSRETAQVIDMPAAALRTGGVDFMLSPTMIAHALIALTMAPGADSWLRVWRKDGLRNPNRYSSPLEGSGLGTVVAG